MSGRTPAPSSSQHYHHQNQNPSTSNKNTSQLRQSTIQCTTCGCLNFSNEATCESCRQKTATVTRQSSSSFSPSSVVATGSSNSSTAATGKSSHPAANLSVSRTAILRKQPPVPPPRTGIVTGLQTGLPIEAYRSGGRRISPLGAMIIRDGEATVPSSSQSLMRSNSSSSESELRTAATSSTSGNSSSSAQAVVQPTRGIDLYRRVLDQQRQGHEAKRKADAGSSKSSADVDEKSSIAQFFVANSDSVTTASSVSASPASVRPIKRPRPTGQDRDVIDLISSSDEDEDQNDSSDANLVGGDETSGAQSGKTTGEEPRALQPVVTATATSSAKPSINAPAVAPTSASASQPLTNANAVVSSAQPSSGAARIQIIATANPSPVSGATQLTQNTPAQEIVIVYEEDYGEAPFRSRCFPSIQFDPRDFPTAEAAATQKQRAKRSSTGVDASMSSSQSSDVAEPGVRRAVVAAAPVIPPMTRAPVPPVFAIPVASAPVPARPVTTTPAPRSVVTTPAVAPAVVPPVLRLQAKQPTEPVVSKPAPAPVSVVTRREEPSHPAPALAVSPTVVAASVPDVVMAEPVQPANTSVSSASASASIRSPRLKRTASGNCEEQAIELGDDDESQEQTFSTRGELFQSRIFQSIEFNASDFSTIHDGLHIARRSKISAQSEVSGQQHQPTVGELPVQQRPTGTAPTPLINSQTRAPAPLPSSVPVPATIPVTPSSRPAPIETSRANNPQGQPVASGRPVNVVPMSPKESPVWSAPLKASAPSVVTPAAPPQGVADGALRTPVPQPAAAPPVASTPITTPVVSQPPVTAPAAPKLPTTSPVVVKPTPAAPAAFQQPAYFFSSRPSTLTPTPVGSRPPAPSVASTPATTPATPMTSAPPVASQSTAATPVFSRPTTAPGPLFSRPTTATPAITTPATTSPVIAAQPMVSSSMPTALPTASASLLSLSTSRSSGATRTTTTPAVPEKPVTATTNSAAAPTTILLARKKLSQPTPPPIVNSTTLPVSVVKDVQNTIAAPATTSAENKQVAKEEIKPYRVTVKPPRVFKPPMLGACSADFMGFMREFIDGDDDELMDDEEETRKLHMQLLEVVDLTSLTDSDDDDDSSDGYEFTGPPTPRTAASLALPSTGALSGSRPPGFTLSLQPQQSTPTLNLNGLTGFFASGAAATSQVTTAGGVIMPPKIARPRAARQMEPCVICEEKRWVRSMIHCKECGKYYHKKCAKEYGDEKICWNCELDGMIDDSELTETHRDEIVGMLSTLRPTTSSSEEEDNDDGEEEEDGDGNEDVDGIANAPGASRTSGEEEESKNEAQDGDEDKSDGDANAVARNHKKAQFPGATTKSMQRWKAFLDVSTSAVEKSFHEVTRAITEDLQSDERKAKYSKGFTTPEIFQAAISEVLDSYADLQDQLDREAREKLRSGPTATSGSGGDTQETSGGSAEAIASPASSETLNAVPLLPAPSRVILDLSGGGDHHSSVAQPPQLSRVAEILDGT